ncbi:hypothetical protein Lal_00026065 [Lupinus albus]|uniref:Putative transcription factor SBP family n=1 Tax=Lupinus albus TaxID=3870 RepID=A0A6A5LND9_LUPAL|nr:putative transcription factor SBP family [Lupinus albus]KAF1861658.1 hypothetical protein Lal_00026065 [Lupinus albus]
MSYDVSNGENTNTIEKIIIRLVHEESRKDSCSSSTSSLETCCCQADECGVNLRMANKYNQRHKVCERHSKAPVVLVSSIRQRFCQQCSKFHELAQFDDTKRSCRERLAGHNKRRRKTPRSWE